MNNQVIYETIKNRILCFQYAPGDLLNEKALADEFQVSRTPVREVLLRLEWERFVTIIPRAGIKVSKVAFERLAEIYQARLPLEGLIGRLVAKRVTEDQLAALTRIRNQCENVLVTKDRKMLMTLDIGFRNILHDAANNDPLKEVSDYLYFQTQRMWYYLFDRGNFNALVGEELSYMTESIYVFMERDEDKADRFRQEAVLKGLNRVRKIFEHRMML